mgnify:CR=1 FL=1
MSVPSTPQDLINLIREKLFNNTSGKIDEPSIREVLEWMVKVLDAKFSFFSPTLTEEQYAQWNLMLDYMLRETKGVLTTSSTAPTGASAKGKYILRIEVTGISPVWTDKTKARYGSDDCLVTLDKIVVFE